MDIQIRNDIIAQVPLIELGGCPMRMLLIVKVRYLFYCRSVICCNWKHCLGFITKCSVFRLKKDEVGSNRVRTRLGQTILRLNKVANLLRESLLSTKSFMTRHSCCSIFHSHQHFITIFFELFYLIPILFGCHLKIHEVYKTHKVFM